VDPIPQANRKRIKYNECVAQRMPVPVSNTFGPASCTEALIEPLKRYGRHEIFDTDRGSQFTSLEFIPTHGWSSNAQPETLGGLFAILETTIPGGV